MSKMPKGKISKKYYMEFDIRLQNKIDRAEVYAASKYEQHKKEKSTLYKSASFEIYHNYCYELIDNKISDDKYEDLIFCEFIYQYTEKMIWKDIHEGKC